MVGYSRLAGADEGRTLSRLRGLRSDLIDPAIDAHHGRIVKRTGDGSIIEFRSVVDAVRCAIEVQSAMVERNVGVAPDNRIAFRIGIHLGDIVEESDGDLMGDGVNIAARLESICETGGVCLSEDAHRQVRDRLKENFVDLGERQLKNIARPVRAYALPAAAITGLRCYAAGASARLGKPHIWNRSACMSSNVCQQIIYLAIELSSSSWVIAYRLPANDKAKLHRLEAGDGAGLLALIAGLRHRLDPPDDASTLVVSCFEAGRDGFWLHRLLSAHGVINHVVEPTSILVTRGARRAKTDRLDAFGLLRVLAAKFAGDPGACRTVVVPSVEEEDAKRPHREREFLVQERVRIENRIAALLATQGVRGRPSLRSWDADMRALRTGDGRPLPTHLVAELNRLRRRLSLTLEMIRELDAVREQALEAQHNSTSRTVKALCTIRGIGVNFASVLTREVFYRTFDNRRQIASYLGLAPTPFQSGGMDRDRRINRAGNSRARKTLVQLAWLWLRYQPESSHAAWFRDRVGSLQGRIRRITIVALARKLLIAIWRFVTLGLAPEGAIIAA